MVNNNYIWYRIEVHTKVAITDTGYDIGYIEFEKLGIERLYTSIMGQSYVYDAGNSVIGYNVAYNTGDVTITDTIGANTIPANSTFYITGFLPIHWSHYIDGYCDKFYWKRIS